MNTVFLHFVQVVEMNVTIDSVSKQLIPFVCFMILSLILLCVKGHCVCITFIIDINSCLNR